MALSATAGAVAAAAVGGRPLHSGADEQAVTQ